MELKEIGYEVLEWIRMAWDTVQWRALLYTIVNLGSIKDGEFIHWLSDFLRRTLLHGFPSVADLTKVTFVPCAIWQMTFQRGGGGGAAFLLMTDEWPSSSILFLISYLRTKLACCSEKRNMCFSWKVLERSSLTIHKFMSECMNFSPHLYVSWRFCRTTLAISFKFLPFTTYKFLITTVNSFSPSTFSISS
jgi:hypothetical protein